MRALPALSILAALPVLAGCDRRPDSGPVVVSAIGAAPSLPDPARGPLAFNQRLLLDTVAQGLVRFDAAGQIEPGIAERWIIIDDGRSYIFRLRDARWGDGSRVTAEQVVAILRRQLVPASRNALLPFLTAIDTIEARTPEVVEIELKRQRPDLLKLFAQPELALFRVKPPGGGGPLRIAALRRDGALLRPAIDPDRSPDDDKALPGPEDDVELIGEHAALAIARFADHRSDLVTGGTFADWPLLVAAEPAPVNRRVDPAVGLFGFAITRRNGFLAEALNRAAVAQAIDRAAIVAAFGNVVPAATRLLPEALDSATPPAQSGWVTGGGDPPAARVAAWRAAHGGAAPQLSIAMPPGPGATILFGLVAANLKAIGIAAARVDMAAPADLRLIDAVAPYDSARWYLAVACRPCNSEAQAALEAARDANTMAERAAHLAEADAVLAADVAFVPIMRPLRWSLVSLRLKAWQGNPRAWHPLNRLRNDTN